ncbi:MAG TPA: metallophosphoesterase [Cytophagales bacterium]|nr:metallophosphoesterase [Cytophagales bacterium]
MPVSQKVSSLHLDGIHSFHWLGQTLTLLPDRAIYWEEASALLLADLHLGKAGHFRKAGIPIPAQVHWEDLGRLSLLIEAWRPAQIILLGDLFHSDLNEEWAFFERWLEQYTSIRFILVKGNHDILPSSIYELSNLELKLAPFGMPPFSLTHEPTADDNGYNIAGHIHPAVRLRGAGRQYMTVPCFHFGQKGAVLPAFGQFTGTAAVRPIPGDVVFAVTQDRVIPLR